MYLRLRDVAKKWRNVAAMPTASSANGAEALGGAQSTGQDTAGNCTVWREEEVPSAYTKKNHGW
jgi:hypothetical protein